MNRFFTGFPYFTNYSGCRLQSLPKNHVHVLGNTCGCFSKTCYMFFKNMRMFFLKRLDVFWGRVYGVAKQRIWGKKVFAFSLMAEAPEELLLRISH